MSSEIGEIILSL